MTMEEHARGEGDAEKVKAERKLAYDFFTRAHKLKPRQITTLYYLAKMLEEDGQKERAKEFIDAALAGTFSSFARSPARTPRRCATGSRERDAVDRALFAYKVGGIGK